MVRAGYIAESPAKVQYIVMNSGEKLTDEVVDERLREVDLDGNQVDLDQRR